MTTFSTQSNIFDVFQIPEIPDRNYWFIRSQGGAYYEDFLINKYIAIAWNDISHDYVMTHSEEQIKSKIDVLLLREESNDDDIKSEKSQKTKVTMAYNKLIRFSKEIKRGDIILLPSSNSDKIAIGIVASDVYVNDHYIVDYLSENPTTEINLCPFHKRRNVNWVQGFDRRKMDIYLQKAFASQHALSNMNNYATYIDRAIYPLYVRNNQTHATFHAVHPEGMTLRNLADLIYTMEKSIYDVAEQCEMPIEDEDIEVKLNIHSPGLVEIIGITMAAGFAISIVVNALNHYKNGGKFQITFKKEGSDFEISMNSESPGSRSHDADEKKIEFSHEEKLIELSNHVQLGLPEKSKPGKELELPVAYEVIEETLGEKNKTTPSLKE